MSIARRTVLKGMAMSGLAAPLLGGALPALAGDPDGGEPAHAIARPTLALVGPAPAESAFVHGARASVGASLRVRQATPDLAFMLELESRLRSGGPMHVIGLLDNASAAPLLDVARSAGASIPWLGQHTARAGLSRHRLLTTAMAEGCAGQLARQLHACGAGFALIEERQDGAPPRALSGPSSSGEHPGQWAVGIGYLLGSLGVRQAAAAPLLAAGRTPLTGSFVSFSIDA